MSKSVLITGGNSGIGFASAELFKEAGYAVYIVGSDRNKTEEMADKIKAYPIVANLKYIDSIVEIASKFHNDNLDVLINNAAVAKFNYFSDISLEDYQEQFSINFKAPFFLTQKLAPSLIKCKGSVVNVSSIITRSSVPGLSLYAATKGALESLTKSLAVELAPQHVRVNAICPGGTQTPILDKMDVPNISLAEFKKKVDYSRAIKRLATPEEIARVIFTLSESTYSTGSIWTVDGGVSS